MTNGGDERRPQGKSVRFPDILGLSRTRSNSSHHSGSTHSEVEETHEAPDYFSYSAPTGIRGELSNSESETESDSDLRKATLLNTFRNRHGESDSIQGSSSIARSEYDLEQQPVAPQAVAPNPFSSNPPSSLDLAESINSIQLSGGLAPGAVSTASELDALDREYTQRIAEARRKHQSLIHRKSTSMSESGALESQPAKPGDIELKELDAELNNLLREQGEFDGLNPGMQRSMSIAAAKKLVELHNPNQENIQYVANPYYLDPETQSDITSVPSPRNTDDVGSDSTRVDDNQEKGAEISEVVGPTEGEMGDNHVPAPKRLREGVLGSLLRLYAEDNSIDPRSAASSPGTSCPTSPTLTPCVTPNITPPLATPKGTQTKSKSKLKRPKFGRSVSSEDIFGRPKDDKGRPRWYQSRSQPTTPTLGALIQSSTNLTGITDKDFAKSKKNKLKSRRSAKEAKRREEQARITIHIADVLERQRFILRMARALMLFGAPSHRLEAYLSMTARVMEIDAQFLYVPGCILVSFGDVTTHTSECKLLKVTQGINLFKLNATHHIYKEVVHGIIELEEASLRLDELLKAKNQYNPWLTVLLFGLASMAIGMFGFGGWWTDMPLMFCIGGAVGFLQVIVAPRSDLYTNVFEITSSILVAFLGRAFGSIVHHEQYLFCFGSIVQGSLALLLPGYIILCGSLELQSKSLVPGSVRMFYSIIYSLFLSFGIALGSTIYGWIDKSASNEFICHRSLDYKWRILFVPLSATFLAMVNQASLRQLPVMIIVSGMGYTVLYLAQRRVSNAASFTSAIGAFVIGLAGNLYSRVGHGLAFAAMLPGILVIVPGGIAAQGSLVDGVSLANNIVHNNTGNIFSNEPGSFGLGQAMIQVAIGITVGLFAATLVVYPFGDKKKRSGLFTF